MIYTDRKVDGKVEDGGNAALPLSTGDDAREGDSETILKYKRERPQSRKSRRLSPTTQNAMLCQNKKDEQIENKEASWSRRLLSQESVDVLVETPEGLGNRRTALIVVFIDPCRPLGSSLPSIPCRARLCAQLRGTPSPNARVHAEFCSAGRSCRPFRGCWYQTVS